MAGELTGTPVTLAAALAEHAQEKISGNLSITFDADASGNAWRKTLVSTVTTTFPTGGSQRDVNTVVLERRLATTPVAPAK